ncbi:MAG: Holliday junction resolvase RuvX [Holosporales bacterium]|nr:Holliday junction resolvase RuvX [Holosporales bacterium]
MDDLCQPAPEAWQGNGELRQNETRLKYKSKYRVLGLDYGNKRIGVALSDINWTIASPLVILNNHGSFKKLLEIIHSNVVGVVVIGLPIALCGKAIGKQLEKTRKFATEFKKITEVYDAKIEVLFWDERFSSNEANKVLSELGTVKSNRKSVDKIAASLILQGFLNSCGRPN